MRPEWITAAAGLIGVVNLLVSLRVYKGVADMRQEVLDRVATDYKRQDVCTVEMDALRASCGR